MYRRKSAATWPALVLGWRDVGLLAALRHPRETAQMADFFGLVALCFALAIGLAACGGGSSTKACSAVAIAGTSTGAYTITITGTPQSGTAQTGIVNLTVN